MSEVKDYMLRPTRLYTKITGMQERINALRWSMLPSGIRYDKDIVQTSPEDPMPEYAAKLDELEREQRGLIKEYNQAVDEVYEVIGRVEVSSAHKTTSVQKVLYKCYLGDKSIATIAEEMCLSDRRVRDLHAEGLAELAKILKMP